MTKPRRGDTSQGSPEKSGDRAAAPWVSSMQDHFRRTGCYRADDLNRLLGDPRDSVAVNADAHVQVHSLTSE
jgi:hypothetical protein